MLTYSSVRKYKSKTRFFRVRKYKSNFRNKMLFLTKIWDNSVLFANDYFTIGSKFVGNTKHLVSLLLFPYFGSLTPDLDEQLFVAAPRSKLWAEFWYFCNLHVTVSLFSSTEINTREKIARNILAIHDTMSICVASPFFPCKIANAKTSCLGFASDSLTPL